MRPATLPRRQVVRHLTLTQAFGGSNPSGAATFQKARSDGSGLLRLRPSVSRVPRYGRQRGGVRRGPAAVRNAGMPARGRGRSVSIRLPLSAPVAADAMPSPSRRGCRDVPMVAPPPRTTPHETPCGRNPAANRPAQTPRDRIHAGRVPTPCIRHAIPFRYRPRSVPAPSSSSRNDGDPWLQPNSETRRGASDPAPGNEHRVHARHHVDAAHRPPSYSIQTPRWSRSSRSTERQELHGFAPHPRGTARRRNAGTRKRASSPCPAARRCRVSSRPPIRSRPRGGPDLPDPRGDRNCMASHPIRETPQSTAIPTAVNEHRVHARRCTHAARPRRGPGSGSVIPFDANAVRSQPSRFARNHSDRMASSPTCATPRGAAIPASVNEGRTASGERTRGPARREAPPPHDVAGP